MDSRYSRQIQLPGIGAEGQQRLAKAKVLIVGVGGLGSPAALYLAAAGIGTLGLVDDDVVSLSNLQRQILFDTDAVGKRKVGEAEARLAKLNPHVKVETYATAVTRKNARELFARYDVIVDGTDNFKTRYLISEACLATDKPHVYGGIFRFEGHVAVFADKTKACYRCLFPTSPDAGEVPNCTEAGVLGALPGIIGSTQALETLKFILQLKEARTQQLFVFDALHLESRTVHVAKSMACDHDAFSPEETSSKEITTPLDAPANAKWIDVRTEEEFANRHHPGARNIPIAKLADELSALTKTQTYVVYCASGARSARAQDLLTRQGFNDVWNIRGGLVF